MLIRGSSTLSSQRKIANQLFGKVNPEQLLTLFCMVCRFLLKYKAVVNGSINKIIEDSAPRFLSSLWDGVVRLHLVIFMHTTNVCVVR